MPEPAASSDESARIGFLIDRDGPDATRQWVQRTLAIYRQALTDDRSHACLPEYRPRFERAVRAFEVWLSQRSRPSQPSAT